MNKHQPILIAGPPRSGTTMIAGLFYHHGVWIGESRSTSYPKTNSKLGTENIQIKKYLKSLLPKGWKNWNLPLPNVSCPKKDIHFKERILELVETDGPWLVKTSNILLTSELWRAAFPDAFWVFPKRPTGAIIQSAMNHPAMKKRGKHKIKEFVSSLKFRQDVIFPFVDNKTKVDVNELVRFDVVAADLLSQAGIVPRKKVIRDWINPEMWHG